MKDEKEGCRCEQCGFRIRGENHKEGAHHKSVVKGNSPKRSYNPGKINRKALFNR